MNKKVIAVLFMVGLLVNPTYAEEQKEWKASDYIWCALGAGAAVAGAPVVLTTAGFTAGGIAAGSLAASAMSAAATTGVGAGVVAAAQSAGAAGIGMAGKAVIGAAGAFMATQKKKARTDSDDKDND